MLNNYIYKEEAMIKKAVIPIAGYGTRMLPATIAIPKTMLNIVDRPVIEYIIDEVINARNNGNIINNKFGFFNCRKSFFKKF